MTHPYEETLTTAVAEAPEGQPLPTESTATSSRAHAPLLTALFASTALAACGGGGGDSTPGTGAPGTPSTPDTPAPTTPSLGNYAHPSATSDNEAARFLLQAQFSASTAEIAALRATTYADWLESQFNAGPSQGGWDWLNQRGYADISNNTAYYDNSYPADYMIWYQLMKSPDGLRKRVALALSEICVVSLSGVDITWRCHAMAWYWDQLVNNAFGNYRSVLENVTLNAAMGYYLNTRGNQKENPATGRQPDENYAREVMQLMSIGLVELNIDGTPKKDGAGKPIDSYTMNDVTNLARVFTGYDYDQTQNVPTTVPGTTRVVSNTTFARLPMALNASRHSTLAATFLGTTIPANTPGAAALKTALDTLFNHPNVGPFIGKQLIQRLVTSNPSPAYVARVAAAFNNNRAGVRGDLRAVVKAILLDDEARSPAGLTQPGFGKLREPMLRFVQWGRTFGINSAQGSWKIGDLSDPGSRLGQSPLRSPSVFNFFRPGYIPPNTALAAQGLVGPEFQLTNESTVAGYVNFMQNAVAGRSVGDLRANYAALLAKAGDPAALVAELQLVLAAGQLSPATVATLTAVLGGMPGKTTTELQNRMYAALTLVLASPEYIVQK